MISIVNYLYEGKISDAAKGAAMVGGLVAGGGALYNKLKHGEAFGDAGIDVLKSAIGSAGLTFLLNAISSDKKESLKKELIKNENKKK